MKIKLAILGKDENYIKRLIASFNAKYSDKIEIYSFTDEDIAFSVLDNKRIDVFLASERFKIDTSKIPKRCGFAYFVDASDIESFNNQRAVCKFQKADLIYKQILGIYSENTNSVSGLRLNDENTKIIIFSSPCGGTGTSCAAAACAKYYASIGKTLYLNLEKFGAADSFFTGEGSFSISDIIYALKSRKSNMSIKLESCVKQDISGLYFYSASQNALDMQELSAGAVIQLINELKLSALYDYIVLDMDFAMDKDTLKIFEQAHGIVWVGDGTAISNLKIRRAYDALSTIEMNKDISILGRTCLLYNKFSSKSSKAIENIGIRTIGGIPVYIHAAVNQIVDTISSMKIFDLIF